MLHYGTAVCGQGGQGGPIVSVWPLMSPYSPPVSYMVRNSVCSNLYSSQNNSSSVEQHKTCKTPQQRAPCTVHSAQTADCTRINSVHLSIFKFVQFAVFSVSSRECISQVCHVSQRQYSVYSFQCTVCIVCCTERAMGPISVLPRLSLLNGR